MALRRRHFVLLASMFVSTGVTADDRRAEVNYMLHCQGCHLPQAEGVAGRVPPMKNFVGFFLHSQEGREFLIRVPGVAHAALRDAEVAELMNWLLISFSDAQLPTEFEPFTVAEVTKLRRDPERTPDDTRLLILERIAVAKPAFAAEIFANNKQ